MDPKQTSAQLDPKLQEAYERVMGTISSTPVSADPAQNPMPLTPPAAFDPTQPLPQTPLTPSIPSTDTSATPPMSSEPTIPSPLSSTQPPIVPSMSTEPSIANPLSPASNSFLTPAGDPLTPPALPVLETKPTPTMPELPREEPMVAHVITPQPEPVLSPVQEESMHATVSLGSHTAGAIHGFVSPKKKTKISPVIIIGGIVAFILLYTLIWIKVFNLQIPFLNQ